MEVTNHIWLKSYPEGIPENINPDAYSSLVDFLQECTSKYGDLPAFENMGKSVSYQELDRLSTDFAAFLQYNTSLRKGDRVAIQMPNLLQYPIVMMGIIKAGLVVVNTNPLYTAREMEHQFKDSGAKALVILENFACHLEKILSNTNLKTVVVTKIGDQLGGLKGALVNFVVKRIKKMVPAYNIPGAVMYKEALEKGSAVKMKAVEIKNTDVAFLQYTGGTTGVAKGAVLTHRNIIANMEQISAFLYTGLKDREEVIITALPLYHVYALTVNCLSMMKIGAKNVLITNPRDMPAFMKELKKNPFTVITGVNTLYNGMLNQPEFKKLDFSRLKIVSAGAMAVQKAVAERWKHATGIPIAEGYGLSETSPVLTTNPVDGTGRLGTIGIPVPSTDIVIIDDAGKKVALDVPGEICAKGPQVMKEYWNQPKETAKVFTSDGWFKTGDIGVMDEDGYLRIVDRKKEMINVSGFKVFPNDVENTIASHEKVLEVGAIGVPDERSAEVVKVFIVKKDESLTEEEIIAYCKDNMTAYKVPKYVEFRKELPKSNVGKILRRKLKEEPESTQ